MKNISRKYLILYLLPMIKFILLKSGTESVPSLYGTTIH